MRINQRGELFVIHDRRQLLGDFVHVTIRTLQLEGWFGAKLVGLSCRIDVFAIDFQNHVAGNQQLFHHRNEFVDFFN